MPMLPFCGGGFGAGGLGAVPFGDGYALAVLSSAAVSRNSVDVTFLGVPAAFDPSSITDSLNKKNWSFSVREPFGSAERLVQHVESTSNPSIIRIFADGPFADGAVYRVTANSRIRSVTGIPIDPGCVFADFIALLTERQLNVVADRQRRTDIANPQVPKDAENGPDAPLGTFQISDRGDYLNESGEPYLRKRILRRATSSLGSFFHLSDYGFSEPLKGLITPDLLLRIQARAQSQVLREPDVVNANVEVGRRPNAPNVIFIKIQAITREGNSEEVSVDLAVSP